MTATSYLHIWLLHLPSSILLSWWFNNIKLLDCVFNPVPVCHFLLLWHQSKEFLCKQTQYVTHNAHLNAGITFDSNIWIWAISLKCLFQLHKMCKFNKQISPKSDSFHLLSASYMTMLWVFFFQLSLFVYLFVHCSLGTKWSLDSMFIKLQVFLYIYIYIIKYD